MIAQRMFVDLLLWCVVAGRAPPPAKPHRDVVTIQGVVRGYFHPRPPHYAYLGLPYGRPPTRRDRFKAPEPPEHWDGIFVATHRVKCPQPAADQLNVNCLTVNVFAPLHASSLPVLVHFHDGDFRTGWGSFNPPKRLLNQGFVIVTFNYRLGIFGFLCLGTPDIPGNAGLKDQVAALYWIYRNIAQFGGNPHDVILYGTGSGAVSVELILLSGFAKGLFHGVILESGSSLSPLSMTYDSLSIALDVAIKLGYNGQKNANELTKFYLKAHLKSLINITATFLPCIENYSYISSLLQKDPILILREENFHHVPLMFVYSKRNINITEEDSNLFKIIPRNMENLLPNNLEFDSDKVKHKIANLIKEFYFKEEWQNENVMKSYMDYMNDIFTEYPIVKSAILHASRSQVPVYLMEFSYNHMNAVDLFFSKDGIIPSTDGVVVDQLTTLWSNFMKFGDPTPLSTPLIPIIWQPVTTQPRQSNGQIRVVNYLLFNNTVTMKTLSSIHRLKLWDYIYNRFYKIHESV